MDQRDPRPQRSGDAAGSPPLLEPQPEKPLGKADPNATAGLAELCGEGGEGRAQEAQRRPIGGPSVPSATSPNRQDQAAPDPTPGAPHWASGLHGLRRPADPHPRHNPLCYFCHPQNVFFFLSPNRLAGKLRVASQPSGSSSPVTYRCCQPPPGPQSSKTWGLEVGTD